MELERMAYELSTKLMTESKLIRLNQNAQVSGSQQTALNNIAGWEKEWEEVNEIRA